MKNISKLFLCLFAVAVLASAQTSTSLAAALSRGESTINLTSTTGVVASGLGPVTGFYVDREYMTATQPVSGNLYGVKRGVAGIQSAHVSGSTVYVGAPGNFDLGVNDRVGACSGTFSVIMVRTGNVITCSNGSYARFGSLGDSSVGAVVASATTITATARVFHVSGTVAIANIVAFGLTPGSTITVIPDAVFATTTAGNIAKVTTAVVNQAIIFTWDGGRFSPSY
jgi:hypothetical protein